MKNRTLGKSYAVVRINARSVIIEVLQHVMDVPTVEDLRQFVMPLKDLYEEFHYLSHVEQTLSCHFKGELVDGFQSHFDFLVLLLLNDSWQFLVYFVQEFHVG